MRTLSALLLSAAAAAASSLVLLETGPACRAGLIEQGTPVYKDLGTHVLLPADDAGLDDFAARGWPARVLDEHVSPGDYFIAFRAGAGRTSVPGRLLWQTERYTLVRMPELEARQARAAGFPMVRLSEHAHPLAPEPSPFDLPLAADTTIARLVSFVSLDSLVRTMRDLQNFVTRYSYNIKCESAAFYLHRRFADLGLSMRLDTYYLRSPTTRAFNVEVTIPGTVRPESVVIACAHFDSYSDIRTNAPGADDNATGTAAILEIARVLRDTPFRWTVKLLGFSGEEQWMKGSYHWVDSTAVPQAMKIVGAYNIDMVAYTAADSNLLFVNRNTASTPLAALAESTNTWYDIGLRIINYLDEDCAGDNTPFWEHGFRSVFALEDSEYGIWNGSNPHYHTTHDTIGNLTLSQVRRTTQMSLACLAHLATPASVQDVEETPAAGHSTPPALPTIVRDVLYLPSSLPTPHSSLLAPDGRWVLALGPGANDLSAVPPGVYFVRQGRPGAGASRVPATARVVLLE